MKKNKSLKVFLCVFLLKSNFLFKKTPLIWSCIHKNQYLKKIRSKECSDSIKTSYGDTETTEKHMWRRSSFFSTHWAHYFPILLCLVSLGRLKLSFSSVGVVSFVSYWCKCYFLGTCSSQWCCINNYHFTYKTGVSKVSKCNKEKQKSVKKALWCVVVRKRKNKTIHK